MHRPLVAQWPLRTGALQHFRLAPEPSCPRAHVLIEELALDVPLRGYLKKLIVLRQKQLPSHLQASQHECRHPSSCAQQNRKLAGGKTRMFRKADRPRLKNAWQLVKPLESRESSRLK